MDRTDLLALRWTAALIFAALSIAIVAAAKDVGWTREMYDPDAEEGHSTVRLRRREPGAEEEERFLLLKVLPVTLAATALLLVPDVVAWRRRRRERGTEPGAVDPRE
jgi:hypothetical protein